MPHAPLLTSLVLALLPTLIALAEEPSGVEFFESRIRPIFVEHCYECHASTAKRVEGGLRLDTPAAVLRGGDSGAIFTPDKPEESSLILAVTYSPDGVNMPPKGKLNERAIADLKKWVSLGAPLPKPTDDAPGTPGKEPAAATRKVVIDAAARDFWSFRPLTVHEPTAIRDAAWPKRKLDYFVRQKLDQKDLEPAPEADARTLCRRLYFDLTGLPPTMEQVEAFVRDYAREGESAYAALVEQLLASPHYGERWGRHWLDVARYAEDNPTSEATCKPPRFPFRYRDWVVRALNKDLPYDEFLRRQLAADLLPELPLEERAATGFLGLSPVYHKEPKLSAEVIATIVADEWDERIDTITRGMLGLTVACARCHDHKFDPIRTEDYYALAGVMASTRLVELPLTETALDEALQLQDTHDGLVEVELRLSYAKIMQKTAAEAKESTEKFDEQVTLLTAEMAGLKGRKLFDGPIANCVSDASVQIDGSDPDFTALLYHQGKSRDLPVFIRGNPARHGNVVPRRFVEVLSRETTRPFGAGSGRRELADAIVRDAAALTARVIVNRVWGWHFGQPLVRTPSNFGSLGDRPSHPELLDDLAARFVAAGWSLKWLHREIVSSATYRQSANHTSSGGDHDPAKVDGDNRLLWRMNRRRLEAEAWRDSVLAVSERLDETLSGPPVEWNDEKNVRRTLYGKVSRQGVADLLRLFDFPDSKQHAEERIATTTPLQQLYLLNSNFVQKSAAALANLDDSAANSTDASAERLRKLFRRALQRDPTATEESAARRLLDDPTLDDEQAWRLIAHGLLAGNEFLHVD